VIKSLLPRWREREAERNRDREKEKGQRERDTVQTSLSSTSLISKSKVVTSPRKKPYPVIVNHRWLSPTLLKWKQLCKK
jgi:hypothetical protein